VSGARVTWPHEEPTVAGVFDWQASVGRRIAAYRPAGVAEPVWERVDGQVRAAVAEARPCTPRQAADMCSALAALAVFADGCGIEAKAGVWLSPPVLADFAARGMPHAGTSSRASVLSRLRALAAAVVGDQTGMRRDLAARDVHVPYRPGELAALWQAAGARDAVRGGCDLRLVVALGAGAGLSAAEIAQVRAHDVQASGSAVVVEVRGPAARLVVVRRAFERFLAETVYGYLGQIVYLMAPRRFHRTGVTCHIAGLLRPPGNCPALSTRRLRASWLAELLDAGVPLPVLAAAAGIDDLSALTRLLRHLGQARPEQAADHLRST
jgi:hypothetical protein